MVYYQSDNQVFISKRGLGLILSFLFGLYHQYIIFDCRYVIHINILFFAKIGILLHRN